jgi:hypothetical protein
MITATYIRPIAHAALTIGKDYDVIALGNTYVELRNDSGSIGRYGTGFFDIKREVPKVKAEADPTGRPANAPGAKLDAGKVRPALVLRGFARALWKVSEVGTFGARKYTDNGWVEVPNGEERYADAQMRHFLKDAMGEAVDADSNIEHLAHEAWNALAKLDLALRRKEK